MSSRDSFDVTRVAGALGAEVRGIDLSTAMSDRDFDQLYDAFIEHLVLFLPDQHLTPQALVDFAGRFGEIVPTRFEPPFDTPMIDGFPEIYLVAKEADSPSANIGGFWHADVTYRERPNLASVGYVTEAPDFGGDTMYSNLYLAYETLSPGMQRLLDGLSAVHASNMPHAHRELRSASVDRHHAPQASDMTLEFKDLEKELVESVHPVVRRHPDSGRKLLYLNRGFTSRFVDMTERESLPLLEFLWAHMERPEFTCRYRLQQHGVVIWDNRSLLHYALNDYYGQRRVLQRVSIAEPKRPLN